MDDSVVEKEHKEDDMFSVPHGLPNDAPKAGARTRPNLVSLLVGNCTGMMCASVPIHMAESSVGETQFVELHGLRFIGLGAVVDELSPKDRVTDTLEQLTTRAERLISIGYLVDSEGGAKTTETIPWDVVCQDLEKLPLTKPVQSIVDLTTHNEFQLLKDEYKILLKEQKANPNTHHNKYLAGITAHNLGVLAVLTNCPIDAVSYFRDAICLKEAAFGRHGQEVALSWDELGIQFFARGDFDGALTSFREAHAVRSKQSHSPHPSVAMVLNNMACCYFQLGDAPRALQTLQEADEIQQKAIGSSVQAELDLLHVAIVICNCGYLKLALKQYEGARSMLEEALLIQQSVLGDDHRAVRDTLSNIEFANAFHS